MDDKSASKPVRILISGIWDLFHYGHARAMERAKKMYDNSYLLVGIHSDKVVHAMKGKVVMEYEERRELLKHIKWVDEIIDNAPWIIDEEFIKKHDIDVVVGSDDVYTKDGLNTYKNVKNLKKFVEIQRTPGISTTTILTRVIRDYDQFVFRAPPKNLNMKGIEMTTTRLDNIIKRKWHRTDVVGTDLFDLRIGGFMRIFGENLIHNWNVLGTVKETFIRKSIESPREREDEHTKETDQISSILVKACHTVLDGWKDVSIEDLQIRAISGGLTNKLYKCTLSDEKFRSISETYKGTPQTVLVRLYGAGTEVFFDRENEHKIFKKFSDSGVGPKLYGLFDGGRIEEFMPYKTLTQPDMPKLAHLIAEKLAVMHTTEMPLPKSPSLFDSLHHWHKLASSLVFEDPKKQFIYDKLEVKLKFAEELVFLENMINNLYSPVVFCHNDLLAGNIMYDEKNNYVCFIDYEYGSYNFRGYDIGNHFCEQTIIYNVEEYPHFIIDPSLYPSEENQRIFFSSYIRKIKEIQGLDQEVLEEEIIKLSKEVEIFVLASHFLWSCWAIIQASTSEIEFGYLEFASERMKDYFRRKALLCR